jgi:hypothetical protein
MYIYDNWGNVIYQNISTDASSLQDDKTWGWNGIEPLNSEPKNGTYRIYIIAKTIDGKTIEKTGRFILVL